MREVRLSLEDVFLELTDPGETGDANGAEAAPSGAETSENA